MTHENGKLGMALGMFCALAMAAPVWAGHGKSGAGKTEGHFQMMDANTDGKLSPDEHASGARQMFETMDADKDGKVTATEMEAAHAKMPGHKGDKGHDAHKAHKVDKMDKMNKMPRKAEMRAVDKIKTIDTNGDGVLTREEHAAGAKTMFGNMDTDKDGFVSKTEMTAGHAKMLHKTEQ